MTAGWEADSLLRELVQAWDEFGSDAAGRWEQRMDAAVTAAKEYLSPRLAEVEDPAPAPRVCP